ncbi:hypothetical protein PTSG_06406 [Salpingoeca rosetta]|uniref:Conserved oligomeric Golgi complex subunit 6 n=1 Tax=Salpingoeca rosetta (strain ATCC 50818 / BSB-021) TaxID=946362 RepID=F2UBY0_SALR5|nr:uncharacterized protein PTSG_06406 [Salpingoeca rosetta]EGD74395.1 hypothetical protein PTSG_06406 [Salpingoeca rosetta]|eukprot:XP_004993295.1 hypothetical protein PTSG_06406 [Salpingoeca rosetta]
MSSEGGGGGHGSGAVSNSLTRKLNKILTSHDTLFTSSHAGIVAALHGLSDVFEAGNKRNDKQERQRLRSDIERNSIEVNRRFLDAFQEVQQKLETVEGKVHAMRDCCHDMTARLHKAQNETAELIKKTSALRQDKEKLQVRRAVLSLFLDRYQLRPEEQEALSGGRPLDASFFRAFERVKAIHAECTRLLRTNQQRAGLDIMDEMTALQEKGYERLYAWTQAACRGLTTQTVDRTQLLNRAFKALREREVLYKYSVNEYTTTRRQAVARGFVDALTRGGPNGTPKPLDLDSHDPILYVSGMLGWLHQAMASERDLIVRVIFSSSDDRQRASSSSSTAASTTEESVTSLMDEIMEGVCRPLRTRWEQVTSSHPPLVACYRIASTLLLYHSFTRDIVGEQSQLATLLQELHALTMDVFFKSLDRFADDLKQNIEIPPADLYPPTTVDRTLGMLQEILEAKATTAVDAPTTTDDTNRILRGMVDPLLQSCLLSAANLGPADMAAFMINCIYRMRSLLDTFDDTDERAEMLNAQVEAYVDTLVNEQAHFMTEASGLKGVLHAFQQWQHRGGEGAMAAQPGLDVQTTTGALRAFDGYLANASFGMIRQCDLLHSGAVRDRIRQLANTIFCNTVEEFRDACVAPTSDYPPGLVHFDRQTLEALL